MRLILNSILRENSTAAEGEWKVGDGTRLLAPRLGAPDRMPFCRPVAGDIQEGVGPYEGLEGAASGPGRLP